MFEIFPELQSVLKNLQLNSEQIKFIGFDWEAMKILKSNLPQYEVFLLFDIKKDKKEHTWHPEVAEMLKKAEQAGVDGLDVRACEAVNKTFVARVKASNMKLYVWTVNNLTEAKRLIEAGVAGITTDRQYWLKAELELNNFNWFEVELRQ